MLLYCVIRRTLNKHTCYLFRAKCQILIASRSQVLAATALWFYSVTLMKNHFYEAALTRKCNYMFYNMFKITSKPINDSYDALSLRNTPILN